MLYDDLGDVEPSLSDLAAIEAEWPEIEVGLIELDAEIRALNLADRGPSELDWRRTRRSEAALTRTATHTVRPAVELRPVA
ncbi:DUF6284 family protein [Actinoplanes sp. NPDC051861]|uniref:DUF6284 family protein n=1 Tax=Actinoplanes sp. NPDC051861 TaxID=3155170 RepID=UPI00343F58FE